MSSLLLDCSIARRSCSTAFCARRSTSDRSFKLQGVQTVSLPQQTAGRRMLLAQTRLFDVPAGSGSWKDPPATPGPLQPHFHNRLNSGRHRDAARWRRPCILLRLVRAKCGCGSSRGLRTQWMVPARLSQAGKQGSIGSPAKPEGPYGDSTGRRNQRYHHPSPTSGTLSDAKPGDENGRGSTRSWKPWRCSRVNAGGDRLLSPPAEYRAAYAHMCP